jgi:hypothetical protein
MKEFLEWFSDKGWKTYSLPIIISLIIDYGLFFDDGGLSDVETIPMIVILLVTNAFKIGILWHMISIFKKRKK